MARPIRRPIRVEFEGAVYHVTARGNERRRIFRSDEDRVLFLETLRQVIEQFGIVLHIYCLMPNHYHLVVETSPSSSNEENQKIKIWARVKLGGERPVDVVRNGLPEWERRSAGDQETGEHGSDRSEVQ